MDALVEDEPDAIADAVVQLLRDRTRVGSLGQAAEGKVRAQFGWAPVAASFIQACELARRRWKDKREHPDARSADVAAEHASYVNAQQLGIS
jgi:hypothetical protein